MNEKLELVAHKYADLIRDIAAAERKATNARNDLDNLLEAKNRLALTLREFVGANIRRKAVAAPSGVVVTVEFISENVLPVICVYEDGEEIR